MLVSRLVQRSNPEGAFCDRDHSKGHNVRDKLEQAKVHGRRFTVGSLTLYHCPNQTTITSSGDLSCEGGGRARRPPNDDAKRTGTCRKDQSPKLLNWKSSTTQKIFPQKRTEHRFPQLRLLGNCWLCCSTCHHRRHRISRPASYQSHRFCSACR